MVALVIKIIVTVVGAILFISILQFILNIHPPRFHDKHVPADFGLEHEDVSFITEDGITIRGWLIESDKANGTVIIGHGYPFDKANVLPVMRFLHPNYNLLFYDHRYFGESEGRISTVGFREVEDVKAAVKFVKKRGDGPIGLFGFSLSASSMLMADVDVNAIIADSPYADLDRMVKHVYSLFGPFKIPFVLTTNILAKITFGVYPKEISAADAILGKTTPIFVIHGDKDSQIPVENSHALKEANPNIELWIVKGADHGQVIGLQKKEYQRRVKDFLKKHMTKASS